MATTRIMPLHVGKGRTESRAISDINGKSYNKWLGDQAKPSQRELLRVVIDQALEQKPASLDELLKLLQENGCEVSKRGKSQRDFLLCGSVCINTGIAYLFSPKMKRTSERIVKFHSLAQFVSNFFDNSVSSFTVSWV